MKNKKIIFTAVIGSLATILQYFAVTLAYVAIMEAIKRGIGHLFSIIFGKVYFGETITKSKILAAFLMIPGVLQIVYSQRIASKLGTLDMLSLITSW